MLQMINVNGRKSKRLDSGTVLRKGDWLVTPRKPGQTFSVLEIDYGPAGTITLGGVFENITATLETLIADKFEFK